MHALSFPSERLVQCDVGKHPFQDTHALLGGYVRPAPALETVRTYSNEQTPSQNEKNGGVLKQQLTHQND